MEHWTAQRERWICHMSLGTGTLTTSESFIAQARLTVATRANMVVHAPLGARVKMLRELPPSQVTRSRRGGSGTNDPQAWRSTHECRRMPMR